MPWQSRFRLREPGLGALQKTRPPLAGSKSDTKGRGNVNSDDLNESEKRLNCRHRYGLLRFLGELFPQKAT